MHKQRRFSGAAGKLHLWFAMGSAAALFACLFFLPSFSPFRSSGDNMYTVYLNGTAVGVVGSIEEAENDLIDARRAVARESAEPVFLKAELSTEGKEVLWGKVDPPSAVRDRMEEVLRGSVEDTLVRCFTLKIGEHIVSLHTEDEITEILSKALSQYDMEHKYVVSLTGDKTRQLDVLTAEVLSTKEQQLSAEREERLPIAGINERLSDLMASAEPAAGKDFEDYELGITDIGFGEPIEVTESYMPESSIATLAEAEADILAESEENQTYEVVSGDTLGGIAERFDLTIDDLLAMNLNYENQDAIIRIGDLITVTVPQPTLTVDYTKQEYYEEDYNEDTIYTDNDSWYTTKQVVVQEPSTGHRRVIALVSYNGNTKTGSEIIRQEVTKTAVPMIIERGTIVPPTYIWPVSGGRISSGFGGRSSPGGIGSTNHKGVDIAVSTGTAVHASSGGVVATAGWVSGYGYVVYINHPDGRQTRYGHLSKLLVHAGQTVNQGDRIALSGSTGNSTGPHLHFEIRINGQAVNPLNYVSP